MAVNLTIENTAGPEGGQAVALRTQSRYSVYYKCEMKGYQDTLYSDGFNQFYRECKISGTVDFIFGNGQVVFQHCDILARQNLKGKANTITAQGRDKWEEARGFTFQFCNVTGDTDLLKAAEPTPTYLGRPWRRYAVTVFMQTNLSNIIRPEGWLEWDKSFDSTVFYGEFKNIGPEQLQPVESSGLVSMHLMIQIWPETSQ
ncbi:Pectinesterase, catalytic [Corchorus capsularis]|uniref:Pectinesterase n=1 Tax=Corchorus capsularis TaxID=210143 RepID=A0A1R3H9N3_COCAP|nr:Pectinesterase, catalytic [Corchorus capsularis]